MKGVLQRRAVAFAIRDLLAKGKTEFDTLEVRSRYLGHLSNRFWRTSRGVAWTLKRNAIALGIRAVCKKRYRLPGGSGYSRITVWRLRQELFYHWRSAIWPSHAGDGHQCRWRLFSQFASDGGSDCLLIWIHGGEASPIRRGRSFALKGKSLLQSASNAHHEALE